MEVSEAVLFVLSATILAALLVSIASILVMRSAIRDAKEIAISAKLEMENIKAREVPQETEERQPPPPPQPTPQPTVEPPRPLHPHPVYTTLEEMSKGYELTSVMLFDSVGLPIDHVNVVSPERGAALLAELASAAAIDGDHSFVTVGNGYFEIVAKVERIGDRVIYIYAKTNVEPNRSRVVEIVKSAREVLGNVLSRRLER
ncbi:MAG: hypothetical protein NZ920_02570 [Aigarchaeota archaeon]|nr:hypothetical protein [Aigarchaeota archaeon]